MTLSIGFQPFAVRTAYDEFRRGAEIGHLLVSGESEIEDDILPSGWIGEPSS